MKPLLIVTAVLEAVTGLALSLSPALPVSVLLMHRSTRRAG